MPRAIVLHRSPIHGRGVFAARDLPAGLRLIQYRGELLTQAQADRRYGDLGDDGHTFLFTLNDRYVVDATHKGNSARWINHSCNPNCEAVLEEDSGGNPRRDRIFIETIRPIQAGEELSYDYGIRLDEPHTARKKRLWACRCGARHCSRTLLKPKRAKRNGA